MEGDRHGTIMGTDISNRILDHIQRQQRCQFPTHQIPGSALRVDRRLTVQPQYFPMLRQVGNADIPEHFQQHLDELDGGKKGKKAPTLFSPRKMNRFQGSSGKSFDSVENKSGSNNQKKKVGPQGRIISVGRIL